MPRSYNRFVLLLGALGLLLLLMSLLYMVGMYFLENKPRGFWQALQWAAGTVSTTGYGGDISWQHPLMVIYVVIAQFIGVMLLFLVFPIYLIPFLEDRFETKLPKESVNAKNHVVIFDYGPAVATLITELKQTNIPTLLIDEDEDNARHLLEQGHNVIYGNLDEGVLGKANLGAARALIVNSSDDRNAATILAARQLGYNGEILALVEDPYHRQPIILAGASSAYTPRHVLGAALAARASQKVSPTVAGIQHLGHKLQVAEARITRDSPLAGKTLAEAALGQHAGAGVTVIGQWVGGKLITPATPAMRLEAGGILVLVGNDDGIRSFLDLCAGARRLRREGPFLIAGGGEVGRKVAELLNDCGEETFIIDSQPGASVNLVGNVLDTQILKQAGLENVQAIILALSADSTTLFSTVIVKDLAPDVPVIARVNRAENVERIYAAGADFALSISQVSGQLLAWRLLGKESIAVDAELRVIKVSTRGLENLHPRQNDLRERTGCTIVAVERGEELLVEFPTDFKFAANDAVYICGSAEATQKFYQLFPQE
ncbi:MAG TPA: NAD-binding protein [Candidatus Limnocylindria bacterium]|nr:NAD-binding protein [Candidatus Limnocylindria bacterium]